MGIQMKTAGRWWMVGVLAATGFAASSGDLRLVEAVKYGDKQTVLSLLVQHVNVNTPQADGATALAWAVHRGDRETAELLLHNSANANAANDYGVSPLSLACVNGDLAMIEILLKSGANPNAALSTGVTPLMTAAKIGSVDAVRALLAQGADVNASENLRGQTALMWALAENHPLVARVLIQHHADTGVRSKAGFTPLLFAAQSGDLDSVRILLNSGANVNEGTHEDGSPLVVASASGHEAVAIFFLEHGADPNAADGNGITSLHYALLRGIAKLDSVHYRELNPVMEYLFRPNLQELVKALLVHGANPNARIGQDPLLPLSQREVTSPVGATPFLLASATYDPGIMRMLIASGADPRLTTKEGTTPLIMAAGLGERLSKLPSFTEHRTEEEDRNALEAVKLVVELGADVNGSNSSGLTAMHAAAYVGSDTIVRFLKEKGADVNAIDQGGQTPMSIAECIIPAALKIADLRPFFVHKSTADLLRILGAKPVTETHLAKELP